MLVHEGEAVAVGVHRELLRSEPRYRAVVTRETEEEAALGKALEDGEPSLSGVLKDLEDNRLAEIERKEIEREEIEREEIEETA